MTSGAEPVPGNPRDGYIDRLLYRPLARPLTRALLPTPISPNAVTLASAAIGVSGGWLVGSGDAAGVLAGVACLVASGILDCCDGELARLRHAESGLGHVLDVAGDTLVAVALLAGIVRRLVRSGPVPGWTVLAALGLGVAGAFAAITWSEVTEPRRRRVARWENRVLDGVLGPLTTRDWYVFPVAFALAGRLGWLVPAAAVGAHVFWIVTVVLLVRVLRAAQLQGSAPRVRQ
jgi:1L-myo-inositol 1-phosphate cytidylyltransferase / CDP-L-myo-inositol myo-inositolphosphotransferase